MQSRSLQLKAAFNRIDDLKAFHIIINGTEMVRLKKAQIKAILKKQEGVELYLYFCPSKLIPDKNTLYPIVVTDVEWFDSEVEWYKEEFCNVNQGKVVHYFIEKKVLEEIAANRNKS